MADELAKKWFVARTRSRQEKIIKEKIDELGIENYLPTRVEVRQWHDRKKKVEMVLIPGTVFIHAEKSVALSIPNDHGLPIKYMIDQMSPMHSLLEVPDKQMRDFIFFMDLSDDSKKIEPDVLYEKGDRVRVIKGLASGLEGELIRINGVKKVVVRIDNIIACSMEVPAAYLEKI